MMSVEKISLSAQGKYTSPRFFSPNFSFEEFCIKLFEWNSGLSGAGNFCSEQDIKIYMNFPFYAIRIGLSDIFSPFAFVAPSNFIVFNERKRFLPSKTFA